MKCMRTVIIVVLLALSSLASIAGPVYWQWGASGNWTDPANWSSSPFLPGLGDDVYINCPGIATISYAGGDTWVNSLHCTENLALNGGTLRLMAPSEVTQSFTLQNAYLDTTGSLTCSGSSMWLGGTVTGWGGLVNSGSLVMNGSTCYLDGSRLTNSGLVTHGYGSLNLRNYSTVENQTGALYDLREGGFSGSQPTCAFNNSGTFRKSLSSYTSDLTMPFNNADGTIDVQSGSLGLRSGGYWTDGVVRVSDRCTFSLTGAFTLAGALGASGLGKLDLYQTQLTVPAGATPTFDMQGQGLLVSSGTTITANGWINNLGYCLWSGGTLRGTGGVQNSGAMVLLGMTSLDGAAITNTGTLVHDYSGPIYLSNSSLITNSASGVYEMRSGSIGPQGTYPGQISNYGVFRKSASTTSGDVQVSFNSTGGSVEALGPLNLRGGGTISGSTLSATDVGGALMLGGSFTITGVTRAVGTGMMRTDTSGTLYIIPGAELVTSLSGKSGFNFVGAVRADGKITNTGVATLQTGTLSGVGGLQNSGTLNVGSGYTLDGGSISNLGQMTLMSGPMYMKRSARISNAVDGLIDIGSSSIAPTAPSMGERFVNAGVVRKITTGTATIAIPFSNAGGTIDLRSSILKLTSGGSCTGGICKLDHSYVQLSGSHSFANGLGFQGAGGLVVEAGISQTQPGSTMQFGSPDAILAVEAAVFGGSGTVESAGQYYQESGGTLLTTLAGASNYGKLIFGGPAVLAGTLKVELAPPYMPELGDEFEIIRFGSRTGYFTSLIAPPLPSGLVFDLVYEPNVVKLVVKTKPEATPLASVASAKSQAEGASVSVTGIVSAVFGDCFYVEDIDRVAGLRVQGRPAPNPQLPMPTVGQVAAVEGILQVVDGNLSLTEATWTAYTPDTLNAIAPFLMPCKAIAGASLGIQCGAKDAIGLCNIGLLVRTAGKVTYAEGAFVYISDGSKLKDGNKLAADGGCVAGLKVLLPVGASSPAVGDSLIVTGISVATQVEGSLVRGLHATSVENTPSPE